MQIENRCKKNGKEYVKIYSNKYDRVENFSRAKERKENRHTLSKCKYLSKEKKKRKQTYETRSNHPLVIVVIIILV